MSWFCELHVVLFVSIVLFKFDNEENDVDEDDSNKEEANEVPLLLLLLDEVNNVESLISFFSSFLRSLSSLFSFLKKDIIFLCAFELPIDVCTHGRLKIFYFYFLM